MNRHLSRWLPALLIAFCLTTLPVTAQSGIPDGVFVRQQDGTMWLVLNGQRVSLPVWAASDTDIAMLPQSNRYAVMNDAGAIVVGDQPAWLTAQSPQPSTISQPASPTVVPARPPSLEQPIVVTAHYLPGANQPMELTLHSFTDPIKSPNPNFVARDGRYVAFNLTARNLGSAPATVNPAQFTIQAASGYVYEALGASIRDPMLPLVDLSPGQSVRGEVAYVLPLNERPSFVFWDTTIVLDLTQH